MSKPKRKDLQRQIALLRRALLNPDYTMDQFRTDKKEALVASGGEALTLEDWKHLNMKTSMSYGVWRLLNSTNEILDDLNKANPNVKV